VGISDRHHNKEGTMNDTTTVPQRGLRITKEHIEGLLAASTWHDTKMGDKTTVVCLRLPNGFEVIESSGCVDPANYDHAMGVTICRRRITDKVWLLEGYRLTCLVAEKFVGIRISDRIAQVCHEVNRAYCQSLGDHSQVAWYDAPPWQRQSAIHGVELQLENPLASPAASHEAWMAEKLAAGWEYGPVKDAEAKRHPCLVPFNQLPREQQAKDYIFRAVVHALRPW
jgi:hypothetical protein